MAITAADVKNLRDATGAGMMAAKKALTEAEGDFDQAVEILRVTGLAKAAKRSDREANNGIVVGRDSVLIHLAAETDFVAKNAEFTGLADQILDVVIAEGITEVAAAEAAKLSDGTTVAEAVAALSGKIGENLKLVNLANYSGAATQMYLHRRAIDLPPQIGVLLEYAGDDVETVHQVAMHIAAMSPQYVSRDEVPAEVVENERRIAEATAREEGKPEAALPKIIEGRTNGFFKDVCLVDQMAVWVDKKTVGAVLKESGVTIKRFVRFAVA